MSLGKRARTSAIQRWMDAHPEEETYPERVTRVRFSVLQEKTFWKTDVPGSVAYTRTEVLELEDSPKPTVVRIRMNVKPKGILETSYVSYEEVSDFLQSVRALPDQNRLQPAIFEWPANCQKKGILRVPTAKCQ